MSELFKYTDFPDEPAEFESAEDEIAQLQAQLRAQAARVEALEAAVNEAREIVRITVRGDVVDYAFEKRCHAWLAAHAPASETREE